MKATTALKTLTLVAASGLLFGCATTQQQEMKGDLAQVRALAERAAADAAAAKADAAAAKADAAEARAQANAAMDAASSAKAKSEETDAKIDRMFKKSMYK